MRIAETCPFGKCNRIEELADGLAEFVRKAAAEGAELLSVERDVMDMLLQMGHVAIDEFLRLQGTGDLGAAIDAADGGVAHRSEETVKRHFRTVFGTHQIDVFVYRERAHPNTPIVFRPIDARLGVSTAVWSPLLQQITQILAVEQSFDGAAESFERIFRQCLSVDTMETVNQQMGIEAAAYFAALPVPPKSEEGTVLVETADAKGVPLVKADAKRLAAFEERPDRPGNRRMATLAGVYSVDRHVRTPEDIVAALFRDPDEMYRTGRSQRPKPCHKQIVARFPAPIADLDPTLSVSGAIHALGWASQQVLQRRSPGQELVCLCDGQKSLWEAMALLQGNADDPARVEILDVLHTSSYVWRAAKVFHSHTPQQEAFARDHLLRILQGKVKQVVASLRARATRHRLTRAEKKELTTVCRYFTANASRMRYDQYLSKGYPIATGVIEGACRHLVKDRMERSGMRWRQVNAQSMLDVRALYQSSYWDQLQAGRAATARTGYAAYLHLLPDLKALPA